MRPEIRLNKRGLKIFLKFPGGQHECNFCGCISYPRFFHDLERTTGRNLVDEEQILPHFSFSNLCGGQVLPLLKKRINE